MKNQNENTPTHKPESVGFDWAGLERQLGEAKEELSGQDYSALVTKTQELLAWLVEGDLRGQAGASRIARRVVAMIWVLHPCLWETNSSMSDLAKHLGIHKVLLSEHAAEFSRKFAVQNISQSAHAHNFIP